MWVLGKKKKKKLVHMKLINNQLQIKDSYNKKCRKVLQELFPKRI